MSIKKRFLKSKSVCKVTFKLPKQAVPQADTVHLVGEFNAWSAKAEPMKGLKKGGFTTTLELENGHEYQFRYLVNGQTWLNDEEADKLAPTPFEDAKNSVVIV